jgi:hypothetical protein
MTKTQRDVASFVVRFTQDLWQDDEGEPHVEWRGNIRHIQGDEQVRFTDFSDAVAFIQRNLMQLTQGTLESVPGEKPMDQEKTLQESFKLWEKFAASYSDMMFDAMEQTFQQSEVLKEQMETSVQESLQAWQPSSKPEPKQVLEALQVLQAQVEALADRVDGLEKANKTSEV